ncbi:MAG: Uma2 family endonuclease, partial [Gemmataceae bacterium]|nr:Uma2 family endonuclease [Gemmataceae bacterium]
MSTSDVQAHEKVGTPMTDPLLQPDPLAGLEDDYPDLEELLPKVELIEEDGEPLESDWHRLAMNLLLEVIAYRYRDRTDYYAGGNMFIYFSEEQARRRDFRGPDFFFVRGVNLAPLRRYWAVWLEGGHYPDVLIELLSPKTARTDRTTKKTVYETVFHTPEYFCYDPDKQRLEG